MCDCDVSKLFDGLKRDTCLVGDSHRTMLEGVNAVYLGDRLSVHATVLPQGNVRGATRGVAVASDVGRGPMPLVGVGESMNYPRRSPPIDGDIHEVNDGRAPPPDQTANRWRRS